MARRRPSASSLDGVVLIDKPTGMSSHDAVAVVRRGLAQRRAGHAGTLDPDASGLLVIGLGRATRLLRFATELRKSYSGEVVLGSRTSTLDASGEVTGRFAMDGVSLEDARMAAKALTGSLNQLPPMVSALRVGGRRLYELARSGIEIERAERAIEVYRFEIASLDPNGVLAVEVDCSSGTYVRSLADDLGRALGGGAHLRNLRRSAIGGFRVADAVDPDAVSRDDVRPLEELVAHLAPVAVVGELATFVRNGRVLEREALAVTGDGPWAVLEEGALIAVYKQYGDLATKPLLVLSPAA